MTSKEPTETRKCPKCGELYTGYSAISRDDDKTEICPGCGLREAMQAYLRASGKDVD